MDLMSIRKVLTQVVNLHDQIDYAEAKLDPNEKYDCIYELRLVHDKLFDCALDALGVPRDNTADWDYNPETGYCRDWISNMYYDSLVTGKIDVTCFVDEIQKELKNPEGYTCSYISHDL